MHSVITIFCAFTRRWAIDDWLEKLAQVEHDPALTNLCIIVDCDEPYIVNVTKKFAEEKGYRSFHHKINSEWFPHESSIATRRMRVADIHNQSKDLINLTDGEIIIGLEDDTVLDRLKSFERLINPLLEDEQVGFVEGVQVGRWGARIIGAWEADDPNTPRHIETLLPAEGYQEITGGGFYGYATRRQLYLNHEYFTSSAQPWGPDVNFGFWLRQRGFKCLVDWQTLFGHNDFNKTMYPDDPNARLTKIEYNKNPATGRWDRTDYEHNRYR